MNSSKTSECKDGVNEIGKLVRANENGGETKHIPVSTTKLRSELKMKRE